MNVSNIQREEKQLENSIEAIITRLNELKNQLQALLFKIEQETSTITWPTILDNFALISAQFTAISKTLSNEKVPPLRKLTVLPLILSQDKDEELLQLTERRIPVFSHDLVPNYLRTKLEPDIESKINQFVNKANNVNPDTATKQTTAFNKQISNLIEAINKYKDEWETESNSRAGINPTTLERDTHAIASAIMTGKELKPNVPQGLPTGGMIMTTGVRVQGPGGPLPSGPQGPMNPTQAQMGMMGKTPGIKTNIKSASQMNSFR